MPNNRSSSPNDFSNMLILFVVFCGIMHMMLSRTRREDYPYPDQKPRCGMCSPSPPTCDSCPPSNKLRHNPTQTQKRKTRVKLKQKKPPKKPLVNPHSNLEPDGSVAKKNHVRRTSIAGRASIKPAQQPHCGDVAPSQASHENPNTTDVTTVTSSRWLKSAHRYKSLIAWAAETASILGYSGEFDNFTITAGDRSAIRELRIGIVQLRHLILSEKIGILYLTGQ